MFFLIFIQNIGALYAPPYWLTYNLYNLFIRIWILTFTYCHFVLVMPSHLLAWAPVSRCVKPTDSTPSPAQEAKGQTQQIHHQDTVRSIDLSVLQTTQMQLREVKHLIRKQEQKQCSSLTSSLMDTPTRLFSIVELYKHYGFFFRVLRDEEWWMPITSGVLEENVQVPGLLLTLR